MENTVDVENRELVKKTKINGSRPGTCKTPTAQIFSTSCRQVVQLRRSVANCRESCTVVLLGTPAFLAFSSVSTVSPAGLHRRGGRSAKNQKVRRVSAPSMIEDAKTQKVDPKNKRHALYATCGATLSRWISTKIFKRSRPVFRFREKHLTTHHTSCATTTHKDTPSPTHPNPPRLSELRAPNHFRNVQKRTNYLRTPVVPVPKTQSMWSLKNRKKVVPSIPYDADVP